MVMNWSDHEEPFAFRCVGCCNAVGDEEAHAHMELIGRDGNASAGFTLGLEDCFVLAGLFRDTGAMIYYVDNWATEGIHDLEKHANLHA